MIKLWSCLDPCHIPSCPSRPCFNAMSRLVTSLLKMKGPPVPLAFGWYSPEQAGWCCQEDFCHVYATSKATTKKDQQQEHQQRKQQQHRHQRQDHLAVHLAAVRMGHPGNTCLVHIPTASEAMDSSKSLMPFPEGSELWYPTMAMLAYPRSGWQRASCSIVALSSSSQCRSPGIGLDTARIAKYRVGNHWILSFQLVSNDELPNSVNLASTCHCDTIWEQNCYLYDPKPTKLQDNCIMW